MAKNSSVWGFVQPELEDTPADLEDVFDDFVGSMEGSSNRVTVLNRGTTAGIASYAFSKWGQFYLATDTNILYLASGSAWIPVAAPKTLRVAHGFSLDVDVQSGDTPPGFLVSLAANQTSKLAAVRYYTEGGTATFKVTRNGSDVTGFTGINATTTKAVTDPTDVSLSEGDLITIAVTAASSCTGLGVTVYTDETV